MASPNSSSGPRFDNYAATAGVLTTTAVGVATFSFADGGHAAFSYTTTGAGGLPAVSQSKRIIRFPFAAMGGTVFH